MALPQVRSVGAVNSSTGAATPNLPAGAATDDILVMFVETQSEAVSVAGWTEASDSPQQDTTYTGGTRLTVLWTRYDGVSINTTTSDSGDHQIAQIIAISGCTTTGNPFDVTNGGANPNFSGGNVVIPALTTTGTDRLVLASVGLSRDTGIAEVTSWSNSVLSNVVMQMNSQTSAGGGGGFSVMSGEKSVTGSTGTSTANGVTSQSRVYWSGALKPVNSGINETVLATVQSLAISIGSFAVIASQILSSAPVTADFSVPAPSVQISANGVTPIGLLLALTKQGNGINIAPSPQTATISVLSPNVTTNQNLSVGVQSAAFSIQTANAYSPVEIFPDTQELSFSLNAPFVDVVQSTTVTASVQNANFSVQSPVVVQNQVVSPAVQSAVFSIPPATVSAQTNALAQVEVQNVSVSIQAPVVRASQVIQLALQSSIFSIPASSVKVSYTNTPAVQTVQISTNPVSFITHNRLSVSAQILAFSIPTPKRAGGFYTDKYQDRNTSYSDKFSTRNTSYSNKFTGRNTNYSDKYNKLNL